MPHTAESLLALGRAFMEPRILLTALELDVFTKLADAPRSAAELAALLPADERGLTILLDALAALELLEKHGGQYRCPPALTGLLTSAGPQTVAPMLRHYAGLWRRWSELTGIVRGDSAARARAQAPRDVADQAAFIGAMHVVGRESAARIVAAIQPGAARRLLDVGGASGTYTLAMVAAAPQLQATIFDFPEVLALARPRLAEAGVTERVTLAPGDFYADELPGGHDLVLLSAIIHQNSRAQNVDLYGKCARALVSGGRLVIRDHIMSPDRTKPPAGAVFAINMLVGTDGGNTYTYDECVADLAAAGLTRVRLIQTGPAMDGLVEAFKP
jgi:predicted O-methyltransferase YrrM